MEAAERALVLKVGRFKEHDAWVRLLHPGLGVQNAFALKLVLFTMREARGGRYHSLEEGTVLNSFEGIRGDARLLGAARHCLKLVEAVQTGTEGAREIFELTVASLEALEGYAGPPEFLPTAFKARLLQLQGLLPDLSVCNACGRPVQNLSGLFLEVDSGRLLCQDCRTQSRGGLALCPGSARTLDWLAKASPEAWGGLRVSRGVGRECRQVLELMLGWRLGLAWTGSRYERS
jgi:DNA repair protein RecO (recombination protein O)